MALGLDRPDCCACLTLTRPVALPPQPLHITCMLQTCKHGLGVQVQTYGTIQELIKGSLRVRGVAIQGVEAHATCLLF